MGAIALSLAMTIAAAGFILQASATTSDFNNTIDARKKWIACQSTAELAMRYMRDMPHGDYLGGGMANNSTRGISTSWPAFTTFQTPSVSAAMGNPRIRAYYSKNGSGQVWVIAEATFNGDPDTARISWRIVNTTLCPWEVCGYSIWNLTVSNWKDTLLVSP